MLKKLVSKKCAAAILGVSESTLVRGVKKEYRYPQPICYDGVHPKWDEDALIAWQKQLSRSKRRSTWPTGTS